MITLGLLLRQTRLSFLCPWQKTRNFAAANVPAEIEVYQGALHGWCVPDMPLQDGKPIYNKPDAERAWSKLVALYKLALA